MQDTTYLDTAATGLLSVETIQAGQQYKKLLTTSPSAAFYAFLENDFPALQANLAKFIGVAEDRMSLAPNFSYAFSILLTSIKPHKQRALVFESDYPSLLLPLELQGFSVHKLHSSDGFSYSTKEIESLIEEQKIEILAISHVQYNTGFQIDLDAISAICKKHDVLLIVDATQSLGAVDFHFDSSAIDVFIASNYKWMNAGFGSAVICFKAGFIDHFKPAIAGYGSLTQENGKSVYRPSASSYFPGHMSLNALLMLHHAVKEKLQLNMPAIERQNLYMAEEFVIGLCDLPIEHIGPETMNDRSAIVVIRSDERLHEHLLNHGIRTTFRNNTSRISFHYTNKKEDVTILLDCLKSFA